ncbi:MULTISPECIES: helix-turn-helix transcriptional regulator [unclassified Variovorax]|uniref:helix-turn-helix transcriptional regulator n=1 Tax=unclassified Variovorax TaxID=663243 RepID=UPI0025773714|nr:MULTISPECIES: helix-turn-helix transcriptional regulator [unclassified Variovorax]MDM0089489.1 helix-turn-helix transcriptional regulator [Variovorax sp. J22G40]MDM0147561.1 helix-turn-helix transcriptional regulator [Variovorax sp. J2P1-31]
MEADPAATADRLLFALKTHGPRATAALAAELAITGEAARQQLQKLQAAGLVEARLQPQAGAGRPRSHWALTAAGHARFPDAHAQLTVQLLATVREVFGEPGLERLIAAREQATRTAYLQACEGIEALEPRLRRLAALRDGEGYMARVEREGADWLLIEDHCPICAAASSCLGFCRSELEVFREVAGPRGALRREEHLIAGARRCVYRITPITPIAPVEAQPAPKMRDTAG